MRHLFLIIFLGLGISVVAQPDPLGVFNKHVIEKWTEEYIHISQYLVKGSPYLLGESFNGEFTVASGKKGTANPIFYDVYNQKVGIDVNKQFVKPDEEVVSFSIELPERYGADKLDFINASTLPNAGIKGFLNLISSGNNFLLLKQFKSRLIPDPQNMYSKDIRIFEQYYDYFIYNKKSSSIEKIRLKEKDILAAVKGFDPDSIAEAQKNNDLSTLQGVKKFILMLNSR